MKTKLYCALDFDNEVDATKVVDAILPINPYFKVGLELYSRLGPAFIQDLVAKGADVFLDLKFHDIPNTVAGAIRAVSNLGVSYVNIHISGGEMMCRAAVDALNETKNQGTKLLGVTVLTSMGKSDLEDVGITSSVEDHVLRKAQLAEKWGLSGIVCSAEELELIRKECGAGFETMVPGIRPAGASVGDQTRIATPKEAVRLGATSIVIGRPITRADDPLAATQSILESMC